MRTSGAKDAFTAALAAVTIAGLLAGCGSGSPSGPRLDSHVMAIVSTSGLLSDPDGYVVDIDGSASTQVMDNDSTLFATVSSRPHALRLSGLANNCTVLGGNDEEAVIPQDGDTSRVRFDVACNDPAVMGALAVVVTSRLTLPSLSFRVLVDRHLVSPAEVPVPGSFSLDLPAGEHDLQVVAVDGVGDLCSVGPSVVQRINVPVRAGLSIAFALNLCD